MPSGILGTTIGVIKGDTRSLNNGSSGVFPDVGAGGLLVVSIKY